MFSHQKRSWFVRPSIVLLALSVAFGLQNPAATGPRQLAAAEEKGETSSRPRLLVSLPADCNTPDGMRLAPKTGDIILACPNFADLKHPGKLMKITPENKLEHYFDMPLHPETGRAGPMGLDFGPDGNLYVADNQYFNDKNHKSRLIRVRIAGGKPVAADVAADGFKLANAVMWRGNAVYVSDTSFDLPDQPGASGIYRLTLDELNRGTVKLRPKGEKDPHLIVTSQTVPNHRGDLAGCDGITFDGEGNLYTGHYGDGQFFKITFNADGGVRSKERLVAPGRMSCVDGIFCDAQTGKIYVADSEKNAVRVVSPDGSLSTLWENEDTDGADGLLDQPCEVIVRGGDLVVACFDMPFPGLKNTKHDAPHTICVIRLKAAASSK